MRNKLVQLFESSSGRRFNFDDTTLNSISKVIVRDFCLFCEKKLGLTSFPTIRLLPKKTGQMSTGAYIPELNKVTVLAGHRALLDILRSIAHELVHSKQHQDGTLKDIGPQGDRGANDKTDIGSWFEDEANAKGGALIKEFSRTYNKIPTNTLYEL